MKLQGEHRFGSSRAEVWQALQDPQVLADSLPGVRRFKVVGEDRYEVTIMVGVGAVKGSYAGIFALEDKRELESCRVVADASGPPGSISTVADMRLADLEGGATHLVYNAEARITGPLAGVGQRMVEAAARKTTREFLQALDERLLAPQTDGPADGATAGGVSRSGEPARPASGEVFVPSPPTRSEPAPEAPGCSSVGP